MAETKTTCLPVCAPNAAGNLPGSGDPYCPPPCPPTVDGQYETCDGVQAVSVHEKVEAFIHPGTVLYTRPCPDVKEFDNSILCDKDTGAKVVVVTGYDANGVPASTAYNLDGTPYAGALTDLESCAGSGEESDPETMCDNGTTVFVRWYVKKDGEPTGVFFDTDMTGAPYVPVGPIALGDCGATGGTFVEYGCLSTPPGFDMSNLDKCQVTEVRIDGQRVFIDLAEGWPIAELADAINAEVPGLVRADGSVLYVPGAVGSTAKIEIICKFPDFLEDFGTGARTFTPYTNYTYQAAGGILDGEYAVATFSDPGLDIWNNAQGTLVNDATGDPNGRVFICNASYAAGEFYRQSATGLLIGEEYRVEYFAANTTILDNATIKPNVRVQIENATTNVILSQEDSGTFNINTGWHRFTTDFSANTADIEFVLRNNVGGGYGNDLAIDQISFSRIKRQLLTARPRERVVPVEVIKLLKKDGSIASIRVFSADGSVEYTTPYPDSMILSVGNCPDDTANPTDITVAEIVEQGCADDVPYSRVTTRKFRVRDGQLLKSETSYVDSAGTTFTNAPANFKLGPCSSEVATGEIDIVYSHAILVCAEDAGISTQHLLRTRQTVDNETGTITASVNEYSTDGTTWSAVAPAGTITAGPCSSCCPISLGTVCHLAGTAHAVYNPSANTITYFDTVTGLVVPAANVQSCDRRYRTTVVDMAANTNFAIAANNNLIGWTVRNRTATANATINVNGGGALPLDQGETISSGTIDEGGLVLEDAVALFSGNGILRVTTVRRL